MRVRWLRAATRDLDAETAYLAEKDPAIAARVYAAIRERVAGLESFPQAGRPGRLFSTRELVIEPYPYLVPYRVTGDTVEVLRVFHTSRKPPKAW